MKLVLFPGIGSFRNRRLPRREHPDWYRLVRAAPGEMIWQDYSGNIGATNVWRTYGARFGVPVMFLDTLKGFVPALLATMYVGHLAGVLAGGAAMLGHWRPLFMRRVGRRCSTCGGFSASRRGGNTGAAGLILVFAIFRYASVASIVAAVSLPLIALGLGEPWPVIAFGSIAALAADPPGHLQRRTSAALRVCTEIAVPLPPPGGAGQRVELSHSRSSVCRAAAPPLSSSARSSPTVP